MRESPMRRRRPGRAARHLRRTLSAMALTLAWAGPLLAEEEGGGGGLFAINPGLIVWTWVIFILLLLVLRKWAWGPILGALEARERRIQETLDNAAREREQAGRLLEEQRALLDAARDQAQQILADSRRASERLRTDMMEEARKQKDQIVASAREEIQHERDQALETLRREAVDLSIAAAGQVLQRSVDSDENRRLVEEYLEKLTAESGGVESL